jgi:hypothetical protein
MIDAIGMIEESMECDEHLNDWERNFLDSVSDRLKRGDDLTENQMTSLTNIWEHVTNV